MLFHVLNRGMARMDLFEKPLDDEVSFEGVVTDYVYDDAAGRLSQRRFFACLRQGRMNLGTRLVHTRRLLAATLSSSGTHEHAGHRHRRDGFANRHDSWPRSRVPDTPSWQSEGLPSNQH